MKNINFKAGFKRLAIVLISGLYLGLLVLAMYDADKNSDYVVLKWHTQSEMFTVEHHSTTRGSNSNWHIGWFGLQQGGNGLPHGKYEIIADKKFADDYTRDTEEKVAANFRHFIAKMSAAQREQFFTDIEKAQSQRWLDMFLMELKILLVLSVAAIGLLALAWFVVRYIAKGFTKEETVQ